MVATKTSVDALQCAINQLLTNLGEGKTGGVAYDTAWVARLGAHYPGYDFEQGLEWLRRNQYDDGSWGGKLLHYHDRFISTLAAIVALREARDHPSDERRVRRGEDVLWKLVGRLGRDDSDTVGFPIISASLAEEAASLGLDVPCPPVRNAQRYLLKVDAFLDQTQRNWLKNSITVSSEALRTLIRADDALLSPNHSVGLSPAATAAYLMSRHDKQALNYLKALQNGNEVSAMPAFAPIDIFEIAWALDHLRYSLAITPDQPQVKRLLKYLWRWWSEDIGTSYSRYSEAVDIDDSILVFSLLHWGGYDVDPHVFAHYETPDHFCCYIGETQPSVSVQIRLLRALLQYGDRKYDHWIEKIVGALYRFDENGSFWWDKWHSSPYYVSGLAVKTLLGVDQGLAHSRFKWILRTQHDDGGWGYYDQSTPEETAYCLQALMVWDRQVEHIESSLLTEAVRYLRDHVADRHYDPLWIGKTLFTPGNIVQAAIISTLWEYTMHYE